MWNLFIFVKLFTQLVCQRKQAKTHVLTSEGVWQTAEVQAGWTWKGQRSTYISKLLQGDAEAVHTHMTKLLPWIKHLSLSRQGLQEGVRVRTARIQAGSNFGNKKKKRLEVFQLLLWGLVIVKEKGLESTSKASFLGLVV